MASNAQARGSPRLTLLGVSLLLVGCFLPMKDYIAIDLGTFHRAYSRHRDPLVYWGLDCFIIVSAIALMIIARRVRRREELSGPQG
jgi:hypothetical protein